MDRRQRELERTLAAGDLQVQAALLQAKLRVGELTPERAGLAGWLGDPVAQELTGVRPPRPLAEWVAGFEGFGRHAAMAATYVICREALPSPDGREQAVLTAAAELASAPTLDAALQVRVSAAIREQLPRLATRTRRLAYWLALALLPEIDAAQRREVAVRAAGKLITREAVDSAARAYASTLLWQVPEAGGPLNSSVLPERLADPKGVAIRKLPGAPTLGGRVFWVTLAEHEGWRIQFNARLQGAAPLKPYRLLGPRNRLWASADEPSDLAEALPMLVERTLGRPPR